MLDPVAYYPTGVYEGLIDYSRLQFERARMETKPAVAGWTTRYDGTYRALRHCERWGLILWLLSVLACHYLSWERIKKRAPRSMHRLLTALQLLTVVGMLAVEMLASTQFMPELARQMGPLVVYVLLTLMVPLTAFSTSGAFTEYEKELDTALKDLEAARAQQQEVAQVRRQFLRCECWKSIAASRQLQKHIALHSHDLSY